MTIDADFTDDWILGKQAERWIELAATLDISSPQAVAKLRDDLTAEQTHAVLELAELRQRGAKKFLAASQMFFTRVALEQSTDQWIAAYKAERFAQQVSVADLCCGIGGDAIGLAGYTQRLIICDRSAQLVKYAQRNIAAASPESQADVVAVVDDVNNLNLQEVDAWHIDPDRRATGRRTTHAELHEPSDESIDSLLEANPNGAIKLAPACEVPPRWSDAGELEWISRGGECRQLVAWFGSLCQQPGGRRATIVKQQFTGHQVVRTVTGSGELSMPLGAEVDRYVYEPDAAALASKLVADLAREHGWWKFSATDGYMTGSERVEEPAATCFEVQDVVPLNTKKLGRYLRERGIGQLEIKHRAVELKPDRLRKEFKLTGDKQATLLVTRIGEKRIAIIANRM